MCLVAAASSRPAAQTSWAGPQQSALHRSIAYNVYTRPPAASTSRPSSTETSSPPTCWSISTGTARCARVGSKGSVDGAAATGLGAGWAGMPLPRRAPLLQPRQPQRPRSTPPLHRLPILIFPRFWRSSAWRALWQRQTPGAAEQRSRVRAGRGGQSGRGRLGRAGGRLWAEQEGCLCLSCRQAAGCRSRGEEAGFPALSWA